jgi:hypothetical protein
MLVAVAGVLSQVQREQEEQAAVAMEVLLEMVALEPPILVVEVVEVEVQEQDLLVLAAQVS